MAARQTKGTLAHDLADRWGGRIHSEQLGDGDFLMTEVDLAFYGLILHVTGSPLIAGRQQVLTELFAATTQDASRWGSSDEITLLAARRTCGRNPRPRGRQSAGNDACLFPELIVL